ncbi:unnamed protein product, partial [Medioppia subpectinata]
PAGPGFTGQPAKNRLAVGDATFVNVIHSNGIPPNGVPGLQGLGDLEALGNIDSYFNGAVLNLLLCSHVRSNNIAINDQSYGQSTGCQPIGYHCTSYEDFMNGLCGDCGSDSKACRPMELNLDYWDNKNNWDIIDTNNKFYINTGDARQSGYCLSHYQIVVSSGQSTCSGSLEIQLSDGSNVKMSLKSKNQIQTNDGNQHYATLHTVANPLPITTTATIKSQFGTNCVINEIRFNFMSNINESSHMPGIYLPIWRLKETVKLLTKVPIKTQSDYCFGRYAKGFDGFINKAGLLPLAPNQMDVNFMLFTCKNRNVNSNLTYLSTSDEWKAAGYDPNKFKDLWLEHSCVNVIAVDWHKPANAKDYVHSAANTMTVGHMIGCVINRLTTELGANAQNFHLLGHSLGGHVVGFAGKFVKNPQIGHITVDDPAGPAYSGEPPQYRLDRTDATYVQAIHTNTPPPNEIPGVNDFGIMDSIADVDIYVNGGSKQPGCPDLNEFEKTIFKDIATDRSHLGEDLNNKGFCNHQHSNFYALNDQSYANSQGCQPIA